MLMQIFFWKFHREIESRIFIFHNGVDLMNKALFSLNLIFSGSMTFVLFCSFFGLNSDKNDKSAFNCVVLFSYVFYLLLASLYFIGFSFIFNKN